MPRLRRADCSGPGISRRRRGRGWQYLDAGGTPVTDPKIIARVTELAIRPAWQEVWICLIRWATYRQWERMQQAESSTYHARWRERQDQKKFDHMLEFARSLPKMRYACAEHLAEEEFTRERVLAVLRGSSTGVSFAWAPKDTPNKTTPTAWHPCLNAMLKWTETASPSTTRPRAEKGSHRG